LKKEEEKKKKKKKKKKEVGEEDGFLVTGLISYSYLLFKYSYSTLGI
jgi:hypothetical protein